MIEIKLFLYNFNNGEIKGEDLSQYIAQPVSINEDITQELDTAEITLLGYGRKREFDPETKFIVEIWESGELIDTKHFVCEKDMVEMPEMADTEYFNHHLFLIEPSAVAQKRAVDNIAVTYKLKDVSLEEVTAFPDTTINYNFDTSEFTPSSNFVHTETYNLFSYDYTIRCGKYFSQEGDLQITTPNGELITDVYNNIEKFKVGDKYEANFNIPKIAIYLGVYGTKTFRKIGYASLSYSIMEYDVGEEYNGVEIASGNIISNSNFGSGASETFAFWHDIYDGEWLFEKFSVSNSKRKTMSTKYKRYSNKNASEPNYQINNVEIKLDKKYKLNVSLYQFAGDFPRGGFKYGETFKYEESMPNYYNEVKGWYSTPSATSYYNSYKNLKFALNQTTANAELVTYNLQTKKILLQHSIPYSAYGLLSKAIWNSGLYNKKEGVAVDDINANDLPFEVDIEFETELKATRIIENFYNQKNLWEILIEVGNYIHAVPEIKFGDNDKFLITFNRLGRTDEQQDLSTKQSVYNFKGIEDYISSCTSYVTNMVQLGSYIEEWVAPKTNAENYLISNDTATINVSKPIIELIDIKVKCNTNDYASKGINNGDIVNMTDFVYESNVFKLLSLDPSLYPNRGVALYYDLGKNSIMGGDYRLPQANDNEYSDYNFKKVIYCAYNGYDYHTPRTEGEWQNIKVNDFTFLVKYRTKESVRQNQTRPDLRKYLLNCKYDRTPQHWQFNNQTDIVIDSLSFGNNIYGKLIKTGNSNYTINEWVNSYDTSKKKGELYRIDGDLYYVAKVRNMIYSTYITSEVMFSKDYNQLSQIIGIPSEPRFYEISEQSEIRRDIAINDYVIVTTNSQNLTSSGANMNNLDHLESILFDNNSQFARYTVTTFKDENGEFKKDILTPLNAYTSENTLTYKWEMVDNYSAGDKVIVTTKANYNSLQAVQYTDKYGKSQLMDFYILEDVPEFSQEQIKALPESFINTRIDDSGGDYIGSYKILASNRLDRETSTDDQYYYDRGLVILKDNREKIGVNYNLQLITDSDTFVISPFVFLPHKSNIKLAYLSVEVNKITNGYINNSTILEEFDISSVYNELLCKPIPIYEKQGDIIVIVGYRYVNVGFFVTPPPPQDEESVKAIAIICNASLDASSEDMETEQIAGKSQFIVARNLPSNFTTEQKFASWYFGNAKNSIFTNKQFSE